MFTRQEVLALWDEFLNTENAFLCAFGEVVLTRQPRLLSGMAFVKESAEGYGYFLRAKNSCYTKEMFEAYNIICQKHDCTYRIEEDKGEMTIVFYKTRSQS